MPLRRSRGKRALITGGAGFIGSHLAEALIARRLRRHGARRPVDGVRGERRAPGQAAPRRRGHGGRANRRRARGRLGRRLPPRCGGRREADSRRADRELPDERPRHGGGAARRRAERHEGADRVHVRGLREGRTAAAARGRRRPARADLDQPLVVRGLQDARRVHRPRLCADGACRSSASGSSTPSARVRAASTGWSSRASWTRRCAASRCRCTATEASRAASCTSAMPCRRS